MVPYQLLAVLAISPKTETQSHSGTILARSACVRRVPGTVECRTGPSRPVTASKGSRRIAAFRVRRHVAPERGQSPSPAIHSPSQESDCQGGNSCVTLSHADATVRKRGKRGCSGSDPRFQGTGESAPGSGSEGAPSAVAQSGAVAARWRRGYRQSRARDYINATVGFEELGKATGTPTKSLMRMFGPRGNPQARNLFAVIGHLQRESGISIEVRAER